jgi:uncharacterized HAD superfamily protein
MRIGIDIDDTICRGRGKETPEALSEEWSESIVNATPIDGASEAIWSLINDDHKIYFISSRFVQDRSITEQWIHKNLGLIGSYTLCLRLPDLYGPNFKRTMIGCLGIDVYIDDMPRLIEIAKDLGVHGILFTDWKDVINKIEKMH